MNKRILVILMICMIMITAVAQAQVNLFSYTNNSVKVDLREGDFEYFILDDGTAQITRYTGIENRVIFPEEIKGVPVTRIGGRAQEIILFVSPVVNNSTTEVVLPDSITHIEAGAFRNCINLKKVNIPQNIESIGDLAFGSCFSCEIDGNFPKRLEKIGDSAFSGCKIKKNIVLPDGMINIGGSAFSNCGSIQVSMPDDIRFPSGNPFYNLNDLSIKLRKISKGEALEVSDNCLYDNRNKELVCVLPKISNLKIREGTVLIADWACCKSANLKKVTIPEGIENIGKQAFMECWNLQEITFPKSTRMICEYALQGSGITTVKIQGNPLEIEYGAFSGCRKLENVEMECQLMVIPRKMFDGCRMLKNIRIPDGVQEIGTEAFDSCDELLQLKIPSSVQLIEDGAFSENQLFIVQKDSYAHSYAVERELSFILEEK